MTKTELDSKPLSDLHQLAADAGVERYRMLTRAELVERLSDGDAGEAEAAPRGGGSGGDEERGGRPPRQRQRRRRSSSAGGREREARVDDGEDEDEAKDEKPARTARPRKAAPRAKAAPAPPPEPADDESDEDEGESPRPKRRRRRRRFGRRRDGVSIQDLLLPPESGRQAVLLADSREAATELLRGVAADLAGSDGPDPVALLIDPSPEELADWKREAPQAEIVSAGQARHASDALSAAQRRAADGEDVILLVDSLTRFADGFGDTDGAKELFDAGRTDTTGKGSLTVVVALERS